MFQISRVFSRVFNSQQVAVPIAPRLRYLSLLSLTLCLGIGSIFTFTKSAAAIEAVELQYQDRTLSTTVDRIRQYAETGEASEELQTFVGGDTRLTEIISRLLVEEITLTGNLRDKIRQDLQKSSIGQFVLLQLNKLIVGSDDLSDLQAAIQDSLADDNKISVLEVAQNYSGAEEVTINLTEVGVVYADVKGFVERVIPALEVAREYLQDYVCDCETAETSTPSETSPDASPQTSPDANPDATDSSEGEMSEPEMSEPTDTPQSQETGEVNPVAAANCRNVVATTSAASAAAQPALEHQ